MLDARFQSLHFQPEDGRFCETSLIIHQNLRRHIPADGTFFLSSASAWRYLGVRLG
jgi:hypothetical protein